MKARFGFILKHSAWYDNDMYQQNELLPYTESLIDACASSPCVHGSCDSSGQRYMCVCEDGFNGTQCDNGTKQTATINTNSTVELGVIVLRVPGNVLQDVSSA